MSSLEETIRQLVQDSGPIYDDPTDKILAAIQEAFVEDRVEFACATPGREWVWPTTTERAARSFIDTTAGPARLDLLRRRVLVSAWEKVDS